MIFTLFIQRPMKDVGNTKVIECSECDWFVTFESVLWTANHMPDEWVVAFDQVHHHSTYMHESLARIIRGWKA